MRFLSYKLSYFPLERSVFSRVKSTVMEFVHFFVRQKFKWRMFNVPRFYAQTGKLHIVEFIDPRRPFAFLCHPQGNFLLSSFSHLLLLLSYASRKNGKKEEEDFFCRQKKKNCSHSRRKSLKVSLLFSFRRRAKSATEKWNKNTTTTEAAKRREKIKNRQVCFFLSSW